MQKQFRNGPGSLGGTQKHIELKKGSYSMVFSSSEAKSLRLGKKKKTLLDRIFLLKAFFGQNLTFHLKGSTSKNG